MQVIASIYPGYYAEGCVRDIMAGTLYALCRGAIAGLILARIYNLVACGREYDNVTEEADACRFQLFRMIQG